MRKLLLIVPMLLLAGCSKTNAPSNAAQSAPASAAAPAVASPAPAANPEPRAAPPVSDPVDSAARAELRVPRGVRLSVRLDQSVDTRRNHAGDGFAATLSRPVVVNGATVIPAGTPFRGHLTAADSSGRLKGRAVLGLTLDSFHLRGREHRLETNAVQRVGAAHKKRNAILIGGGAGLGAALGALAGGGKGALIGAGAGAGAGTAGAAATGKKDLTLAAETPLVFTTRSPVVL